MTTELSEYNYLIKIIMIGDSGVGKSSILQVYVEPDKPLNHRYIATIGIDFRVKRININNNLVKLQIWDTAGQERFKTITQSYYRGAQAVMIVFDHTSLDSFKRIDSWIESYKKYADDDKNIPIVLLGNKIDVGEDIITETMINEITEKHKLRYFPVSAISGYNINNAFEYIGSVAISSGNVYRANNIRPNKIVIEKPCTTKKNKSCCDN